MGLCKLGERLVCFRGLLLPGIFCVSVRTHVTHLSGLYFSGKFGYPTTTRPPGYDFAPRPLVHSRAAVRRLARGSFVGSQCEHHVTITEQIRANRRLAAAPLESKPTDSSNLSHRWITRRADNAVQPDHSKRIGVVLGTAGASHELASFLLHYSRMTGKPSIIQRASVGWQFSGRATLEEAPCRELLLQNDHFLKHQ